jgi:RNA polymerase sigma-70 factor (ECF subfamily)
VIDEPRAGHPSTVVQADSLVIETAPSASGRAREFSAVEREELLRALVDAHFSFIWRALRGFGLAAVDADDATQRVFVVASRKLAVIEPGRERSFLFGTAYRVGRELRRAKARRREAPLGAHELDAVDPAPNPEDPPTERAPARYSDGCWARYRSKRGASSSCSSSKS